MPVRLDDARAMALAFPKVASAPHFDRIAFRVDVTKGTIFATLGTHDGTMNLKLTPPAQRAFCAQAPKAFEPIPNKWGAQGWTRCDLARATKRDLSAALALAYERGAPKPRASNRSARA